MTQTKPMYSLQLLGLFKLTCNGAAVDLAYEKARALLAYLALQSGRTSSRAHLSALFWPDLERATALANLRQVLHNLRRQISPNGGEAMDFLQVTREAVTLQLDDHITVDVIRLMEPVTPCTTVPAPGYCETCLTDMAQCAELYQGELLQGISLPDCPEFEDWLLTQREVLLQRALARLAQLSDSHERAGAYATALPFAQRSMELDPWSEHGCRRVMRLMAGCGRHTAAHAYFERWCRVVNDELGLMPSPETRALAHAIQTGALPQKGRRATDAPSTAATAPASEPTRAQRRQVTVLHCTLDMDLDEDPDAALLQLRAPQLRYAEIIRAHGGYLVQSHGGSLLAYFGYPQASENAARQAVKSALALRDTQWSGVALRVGLHTGMVISGGEPGVPDAIGAASNGAIRLHRWTGAGDVAISRSTYRLVGGYFDCVPLQTTASTGLAPQTDIWRVLHSSGARDRLEAASALTPLIGRSHERATLLDLWQQALHGTPRAVLIQGHAGMGKSRLVLALKHSLQEHEHSLTELRCMPEYSQTPFHPLVELFQRTIGFVAADTAAERGDKLARYVRQEYPLAQEDVQALLANLLSLPVPDVPPGSVTTSAQQREHTLQVVLERLYTLAQPRPVLFVVEDVHWADPSSLELLKRIITHQRPGRWMAVMTARPDFVPPWGSSLCSNLALSPLDEHDAAALIAAVVPDLKPTLARAIVERADGVPLFVEELAKEVNQLDLLAIPSTLQDLLATRLDALGPAKLVAQQAATIGRMFDRDFLCRVGSMDEKTIDHSLRQLIAAGLLQAGEKVFQFGHALLRDAAYQSQTRPEREAIHLRIAKALQTQRDVLPELLAQHWAAAGHALEATHCWLAAAQRARQQSAHHEVVMHCQAGLALVPSLADSTHPERIERDLQLYLGAALCATQGYTCASGAAAYERAVSLFDGTEPAPSNDLIVAMWGLWASASQRVNYHHSMHLAQQLLAAAQRNGDVVNIEQANFALGVTQYRQGHFSQAHAQFLRVQQSYIPDQHAQHVAHYGEDVGVTNGSHLSGVLWLMGLADQSLRTSGQTVAYARELDHPYSLAYALTYAMQLHCQMRQPAACIALADETLALAHQHGFALWQVGAALMQGWALAQMQVAQGIEVMQQCVQATRAVMGSVELLALVPMANAALCLGNVDLALATLQEAFATREAKADFHLDAELHRLQGEALCLQSPANADQAIQCFKQALHISQQQGAHLYALRAAASLARVQPKKRKPNTATVQLEGVYARFSEGLDLPDLLDARLLLTLSESKR